MITKAFAMDALAGRIRAMIEASQDFCAGPAEAETADWKIGHPPLAPRARLP